MKVFVAGGTGAIGQRLVPQLVAAGHRVFATTRSPRHDERLTALGAEPLVMDGLDGEAVMQAVGRAEPEMVIHEMSGLAGGGSLRRFDRWFASTNELRTTGTDHLIRAAQRTGVRRLIVQSYTGWSNERAGGPVKTEEDPLDPRPPRAMGRTLAGIRYLERVVSEAEGLEGVVLRYGSFYGPGTSVSNEYVDMIRKRRMPIVGDGGGVWSFIHVDDAAAATVAAMERGAPGVYNVVDDDPAPVSVWLPYLAKVVGAKPPRRIPVWLGRVAAGEVGVSMMTQIRGSSNAKAKRELGWDPRYASWREGFRAYDEGPNQIGEARA
jgi:2-alkyl-3-oxoalkanoate reductase